VPYWTGLARDRSIRDVDGRGGRGGAGQSSPKFLANPANVPKLDGFLQPERCQLPPVGTEAHRHFFVKVVEGHEFGAGVGVNQTHAEPPGRNRDSAGVGREGNPAHDARIASNTMPRLPGAGLPESVLLARAGHEPTIVGAECDIGVEVNRQISDAAPRFGIPYRDLWAAGRGRSGYAQQFIVNAESGVPATGQPHKHFTRSGIP